MKILAIVVCYNGLKWLDKCIGSLQNSEVPVDVFFVDNASKDHSVAFVKENYPLVTIFESQINLGFGKANNLGLKHAITYDYDYAFLLNQDAWIESDTIKELVNVHQKDSDFGILAPLRRYRSGFFENDVMLNIAHKGAIEYFTDLYDGNVKDVYSLNFIAAAGWLISKSCLSKVGGFDDKVFFHYGEDNDYCQRVLAEGFKIGVCSRSIMVHDTHDRKPDKTMNLRRTYALSVYNLRYSNMSLVKKCLVSSKLFFILLFHKHKVIHNNRITCCFRLKSNMIAL